MISQQLEQQKEYVAYKEVQLTKNDTGNSIGDNKRSNRYDFFTNTTYILTLQC